MKKFVLNKYFWVLPIVGFVFLFGFLILQSNNFNLNSYFNEGDTWQNINPGKTIYASFFTWEETNLGRIPAMPITNAFFAVPQLIFFMISQDVYITSFLTFLLFFAIIPIGSYLLSLKLSNNNIFLSILVSFIFTFNLFSFSLYHQPVMHMLFFYGVGPILLLLYIHSIEKFSVKSKMSIVLAFFIGLLYIGLTRAPNLFAIYFLLIPVLSIIFTYKRIFLKKLVIPIIIISLFVFLVNFSIFAILLANTFSDNSMSVNVAFSESTFKISNQFSLIDSLRGIRNSYSLFGPSLGVYNNYYYENLFSKKPSLDVVISFFLIILLTIFLLIVKNKKIIFLSALILLGLFFSKMLTAPFSQLFEFMISFNPFLVLLRSSWKYGQIVIAILIMLSLIQFVKSLIINKKLNFLSKKIIIPFIIIVILYSSIPFSSTGTLIKNTGFNSIPIDYFEMADYINSDKSDFKIFPISLTKHFAGYNIYDWNYAGPDILYHLINKPIIDKFHYVVSTKQYILWLDNITKNDLNLNLIDYLSEHNVKYILVRKDYKQNEYLTNQEKNLGPIWGTEKVTNFIENGIKNNKLNLLKDTNNLSLYELKNFSNLFISDVNLSYTKINPTYYQINFSNQPKYLLFNQEFNTNWELECENYPISPNYGLMNTFKIDSNSCLNANLKFKFQDFFLNLITISLLSIVFLIGFSLIILNRCN
jgi:hypothetical protein